MNRRSKAEPTHHETPHVERANKTHRSTKRTDSPTDQGIRAVALLERSDLHARPRVDQIAAAITRAAGSSKALVLHGIWFPAWIIANTGLIEGFEPFDPFPFSLLTTIVSLEAIFLTLFVLISQNRMSQQAEKRDELDLQINLLAERETTVVLKLLHEIGARVGVKGVAGKEVGELLKKTRVEDLAHKLEKALPTEK
jgi:uncharacterized membrane protein